MRRLAAFVLFSSLFLFGCSGSGGSGGLVGALPEAKTKEAARQIQALVDAGIAPGVIVSVTTPEGNWTQAFGVSNTSTGQPMSADMAVRVGSNTKVFVTTTVLQLVDEGKVNLDDPISKYVPGVPRGDEITVRMLGSMTAGLPSYTEDDEFVDEMLNADWTLSFTAQELLTVAFGLPGQTDPGTVWHYSNTNTVVLGQLIERVEGKPLQQVMKEKIWDPLGMTRTYWPTDKFIPPPFSYGYSVQNRLHKVQDATFYNPTWGNAAGQMISTMRDMSIWARAMGSGALLKPETQASRMQWAPLAPNTPKKHYMFGLGYFSGWLGHSGELPGYNSVTFYLPALDSSIVLVANSDIRFNGRDPAPQLLELVSRVFFPDHEIDYVNPK